MTLGQRRASRRATLVAAARAHEADEILIVGHSAGGGIAPVIVARAYETDPELGRHGPNIILLTLGSLLPAFALDREAQWLRGIIRQLSEARELRLQLF